MHKIFKFILLLSGFFLIGCSSPIKSRGGIQKDLGNSDIFYESNYIKEASPFLWRDYNDLPLRLANKYTRQFYAKNCKTNYKKYATRFFRVRYRSQDDLMVEGIIGLPPKFNEETKYPAIVFAHNDFSQSGGFSSCLMGDIFEKVLSKGYVYFYPQYRGVGKSEGYDEFGGSERRDVFRAVEILKDFYFVNKDQVYLIGEGRGTFLILKEYEESKEVTPILGIGLFCPLVDIDKSKGANYIFKEITTFNEKFDLAKEKKERKLKGQFRTSIPSIAYLYGQRPGHNEIFDFYKYKEKTKVREKEIIFKKANYCLDRYQSTSYRKLFKWFKALRDNL